MGFPLHVKSWSRYKFEYPPQTMTSSWLIVQFSYYVEWKCYRSSSHLDPLGSWLPDVNGWSVITNVLSETQRVSENRCMAKLASWRLKQTNFDYHALNRCRIYTACVQNTHCASESILKFVLSIELVLSSHKARIFIDSRKQSKYIYQFKWICNIYLYDPIYYPSMT
jgi:hypothetical protein